MIELWKIPILFVTGLVAGFVDSIAGGGGLITLPVLLTLIPDPQLAFGTNKMQACFGSASAAWHYAQGDALKIRESLRGCLITFFGAVLGTFAVQSVGTHFLKIAAPLMLLAIAIYTITRPQLGGQPRAPKMTRLQFDLGFGLLLGFYDGFFGPGAGTFWTMAFVLGLGFHLTSAIAHTKAYNFASNICSFMLFAWGGRVDWAAGASMGVGQLIGARFGSRLVLKNGAKIIRPIFIIVVLGLTLKLLYDAFVK
jgi:uncharacterized membrane protein YfcA